MVAVAVLVIGLLWPVIDELWTRFDLVSRDSVYRSSFLPSFNVFDDVVRFIVGGNGWEFNIGFQGEWQYQGSTLLIRESNVFNLIATFGILPMAIVFWRWLIPLIRLRSRHYETDPAALPYIAAFLVGIFTMVHDNGIIHWNNIFFFYAYYEIARRYQTRKFIGSGEVLQRSAAIKGSTAGP